MKYRDYYNDLIERNGEMISQYFNRKRRNYENGETRARYVFKLVKNGVTYWFGSSYKGRPSNIDGYTQNYEHRYVWEDPPSKNFVREAQKFGAILINENKVYKK